MASLGYCKCCLDNGFFKSIWSENQFHGEIEVYGEIISKCFSFSWHESSDNVELICDECIRRLRDAFSFKEQIMAAAGTLKEYLNIEMRSENERSQKNQTAVKVEQETEDDEEYMEVEYLQDDDDDFNEIYKIMVAAQQNQEATTSKTTKSRNVNLDEYEPEEEEAPSDEDYEKPKKNRRGPQKKKRSRRRTSYRKYTEQQLKDAIEAVKANRLTLLEASLKFNVPKKTLAYKWVQKPKDTPEALMKEEERSIQASFVRDIEMVLEYTNVVPFKAIHSRYYCVYCGAPPRYEKFEDLKNHVNTEHTEDRTQNIDQIMKPTWLNEVLRVDIADLHCTVCVVKLEDWNAMFQHLKDQHSVELQVAYTRIIPYTIRSNFPCALCKKDCQSYHYLDCHMNAHYNNYICAECGDSYLTKSRYEKHLETHENGKYPCKVCGRVFTLEKYMRKHMKYSHVSNSIRCRYCDERFHGEYHRHLHILESHKEKVKIITCELCGAVFDWRPYYIKHMKRHHNDMSIYECKYCDSKFFSVSDLRVHRATHSGEKRFRCNVCDKRYKTAMWLKNHMNTHSENNKTTVVIVTEKKPASEVNDSS